MFKEAIIYSQYTEFLLESNDLDTAAIAFKHIKKLRDSSTKIADEFPEILKSTKAFLKGNLSSSTMTSIMIQKADLIFKIENFKTHCQSTFNTFATEALLYVIQVVEKLMKTIEDYYNKIRTERGYRV